MGWDLFSKKPGRNWARGDSSKKSPKLTKPFGTPTKVAASRNPGRPASKGSFVKPTLPFNIPLPFRFSGEIVGGSFVGEEERELARYGGSSERGALRRRSNLAGENIRDADMDDDGDEDRQPGSRGRARKAAGATSEAMSKTATSASQALAVTAAASQLSRLARRGR